MKAQKTFKLGEYAVGGIITVEINGNEVTVISKQRGRAHDIESMAMHLLKNDEGRYQLELLTNQSI